MRTLLLILPLAFLGACYTRLNHPQILAESRAFRPDSDADCASCHAGESWLDDQTPESFRHRVPEAWAAFQGSGTRPSGGGSSASWGGATNPPAAQPPISPTPPSVMGQNGASPRQQAAAAASTDSSARPAPAVDPPANKAAKGASPRKRGSSKPVAPVKPVEPAKPDSVGR